MSVLSISHGDNAMKAFVCAMLATILMQTTSQAQLKNPACPQERPFLRCVVDPETSSKGTPYKTCAFTTGKPGDSCLCRPFPAAEATPGHAQCTES